MNLSPEVIALKDQVRRFVEKEVEPQARWIEENDAIPEELMAKAREMGLFGITIPEEYGGGGFDLAGKCAIDEELARSSYAFSAVIANHTGISTTGIVALGSEALKRKYLPRMATGEWIGCFALTEPEAAVLLRDGDPEQTHRLHLLDDRVRVFVGVLHRVRDRYDVAPDEIAHGRDHLGAQLRIGRVAHRQTDMIETPAVPGAP